MTASPIALLRLAARLRLDPAHDLHPSWLPPSWPARHRHPRRLGPAGHAALADWLRESMPDVGLDFGSVRRRLVLMDSGSLRRAAFWCGLAAHAPFVRGHGALSAQLRRQSRRIDREAPSLVLERLPRLGAFRLDTSRLEQRPIATGRTVFDRGYRLLQGAVAAEGHPWLQRLQRKLPRRVALLRLPTLDSRQCAQLDELLTMGIVPERLAQWDWLF